MAVNCMTRGPGPRVAAQLALLREAADEVVVAVDDRADGSVVDELAAVADRILLYPYAEPVDRPLAWLHEQSDADWMLTIDDDEVASAELVAALPELVRSTRVTHYWLPRRELYPSPATYLDAPPWRPAYLLRLVRNDRRLLRFPDETHRPIEALGPCEYLGLPLYHLDSLLNPTDARERKAERYERLWPGKRVRGLPMNHAHYLPERVPGVPTAPVPEADAVLIQRALAASPSLNRARRATVRHATRAEIDRLWEGRALGDAAYRARLDLLEDVPAFVGGESRTVDLCVHNFGDAVWPWGQAEPLVRVVARWPGANAPELRTALPREVAPGETTRVPAAVAAPTTPGRHRLRFDLVHEHVRWFGCDVDVEVEVLPRRRVALAGDVGPFRTAHDAERLREALVGLACERPELEPVVLAREPRALDGVVAATSTASAHAYLLDRLPRNRVVATLALAARAARLVRAARAGTSPLPLDDVEELVLVGAAPLDESLPLRELAVHAATALAARAAGATVATQTPPPRPRNLAKRVLLRLAFPRPAPAEPSRRARAPQKVRER